MKAKEVSEMNEMDIYDKEVLLAVAKRLKGKSGVLSEFEKFLDVLKDLEDWDRHLLTRNRELKGESSIEVLKDLLALLRYKDKFERLLTIVDMFDTEEKMKKLEKFAKSRDIR